MDKLKLPDFDDMLNLGDSIGRLKTALLLAEFSLDLLKARITTYVLSHPELWGKEKKEPSNAHMKDTFHVFGYNDETQKELHLLRVNIANLTGQLKSEENKFRVYEDIIGVWRTQSANDRYDNS